MFFDGEAMRISAGPTIEENRDEITSSAEKLYGAYKENVQTLLADKGQQLGKHDDQGHIDAAHKLLLTLDRIRKMELSPKKWPEGTVAPDHIPVVFFDKEGKPVERVLDGKAFSNPQTFIKAVEEVLMVSQIKGL
jgi:hypothetical protein